MARGTTIRHSRLLATLLKQHEKYEHWHEEDSAIQQEHSETAVLATLTDEQLCDVLLASYTPIAERTPQSWER